MIIFLRGVGGRANNRKVRNSSCSRLAGLASLVGQDWKKTKGASSRVCQWSPRACVRKSRGLALIQKYHGVNQRSHKFTHTLTQVCFPKNHTNCTQGGLQNGRAIVRFALSFARGNLTDCSLARRGNLIGSIVAKLENITESTPAWGGNCQQGPNGQRPH